MISISLITRGLAVGKWSYRVHLSAVDDWSGTADTMDEAWKRARALYNENKHKLYS